MPTWDRDGFDHRSVHTTARHHPHHDNEHRYYDKCGYDDARYYNHLFLWRRSYMPCYPRKHKWLNFYPTRPLYLCKWRQGHHQDAMDVPTGGDQPALPAV